MNLFTGSGVAIVTPFTDDNKVNYTLLEELIEFQIKNETDAIIACGTTGEASTLSSDEYKKVVEFIIHKVNKRVPVIAGTGSNNTQAAIEKSILAESLGADGLLVVTPYYNKTTQAGLLAHYKAIAESVKVPIVLYNVPSRTSFNIEPRTVFELSKIPNIIGIKEASGNITQVAKIASLCDKDFAIYSGNDSEVIPVLSLGGKGVISTMANIIPKETHDIVKLYLDGKSDEALKLQLKYMDLINYLFIETNPIPIKAALNIMGYKVNAGRLPLVEMNEKNQELLSIAMKCVNLCNQ
jgi:4-hydroxy-tetrahydrodipicolinate synthase